MLSSSDETEQLYNQLFGKILPRKGQVIVITDACIADKVFMKIAYSCLYAFITDYYPAKYGMGLFQPQDVIFWDTDTKHVLIIHHEGYYAEMHYS